MKGFKVWSFLLAQLLMVGLFFVTGCSKKDYTKEPPPIHWDRDLCDRCKMAISERKFAVQAVDDHQKVYRFDDIGCYVLWKRSHPDIHIVKVWITDAKTGKWIDAKKARYVKGYTTPMDFGYGALLPSEAGDKGLSYEEMEKTIKKRKMHKMHMEQH
ncbi:hypothetical protein [Nitratiruptor sp. SB155-2]|uniref:hypothetical protein n=1 Tax=Nitratiruptor sp. (strain SB155-2) TaxID=387092 RepID=UPI0001587113|nr:hypothetical protein [Nitratiruptor sp. SB155-2]BAF70886.1 conserved hypothetical protein [Nitratiruptor sp. SB155-2]